MPDEPGMWVDKDAVVMPVLPPDLELDPLLAALLHLGVFVELSGDDTLNPDWAVEALEHVAYYLLRLPDDRVKQIQVELDRVAAFGVRNGWPEDLSTFVSEFLRMAGVGVDE